jgi:hypothetical protein
MIGNQSRRAFLLSFVLCACVAVSCGSDSPTTGAATDPTTTVPAESSTTSVATTSPTPPSTMVMPPTIASTSTTTVTTVPATAATRTALPARPSPLVWPPPVPECPSSPFRFVVPEPWWASIPSPGTPPAYYAPPPGVDPGSPTYRSQPYYCTGTALAQSLFPGAAVPGYTPTPGDRLADGLPGYFHSVQTEPSYPVHIGMQVFRPTDSWYIADAAAFAEAQIRMATGQDARVVLDDQRVTITPPLQGVSAQRVTNANGLVGIKVDIVVQIYQQYAGRVQQGSHIVMILVTRAEGEIINLQTEPLDASEYPSDAVIATIDAVFATLQIT